MRSKKITIIAILTALLMGTSATLHASGLNRYKQTYPAALCSSEPGIQANGAVGIGNWSGNTQSIYCPIINDQGYLAGSYDGYVEFIGLSKIGTVNCSLFQIGRSGAGWIIRPNATGHYSTYDEIRWFSGSGGLWYNRYDGLAIECDVKNGATVQSYRVDQTVEDWH